MAPIPSIWPIPHLPLYSISTLPGIDGIWKKNKGRRVEFLATTWTNSKQWRKAKYPHLQFGIRLTKFLKWLTSQFYISLFKFQLFAIFFKFSNFQIFFIFSFLI
jgi:hypothetical protein